MGSGQRQSSELREVLEEYKIKIEGIGSLDPLELCFTVQLFLDHEIIIIVNSDRGWS